jgi:hypothetical protein
VNILDPDPEKLTYYDATKDNSIIRYNKIMKGNHEINPDLNLGYNSFSGLTVQTRLAYRYFILDKLSLGLISGLEYSEYTQLI